MSNNIAQDNIVSTEQRYKNARRILEAALLEEAIRKEAERRSLRPTSIWPAGTFNTEDIPQGPDNWLYNALSDPKLNMGLENLAVNAADIILGIESGNPLVDLGTSNIPGVGAASILAAGGMPGLVDAVGIGELKNMKRIPKYTYEFVKKYFGDNGLRNLDNALTKYPKAGNPSVNDARYILKTGLGGEQVTAVKPYSTGNVTHDIDIATGYPPGTFSKIFSSDLSKLRNNPDAMQTILDRAARLYSEGLDNGDIKKVAAARQVLVNMDYMLHTRMPPIPGLREMYIKQNLLGLLDNPPDIKHTFDMDKAKKTNYDAYMNLYTLNELDSSPTQNWDKIVADQKYLDEHPEVVAEQARKAEEAALKSKLSKMSKKERKAYEEKLRKQQQQQQQQQQKAKQQAQKKQSKETKSEPPKQEQPIQAEVKPEVKETPKGGPNMWRENGWDPNIRGDVFYGKFGGNLSDESKRDAFVMDSLANYWVRQIVGEGKEGKLSEADIFDAKDRADARHKRSNYDKVSQGFYNDIKKNIETGNMPGKSVMFGPKYKRNVRTNRDTPTLILRAEENPKYYDDIRIWADEQDGPDIYEILFRPEVDKRLNKLNEAYWLYNSSKR